MNLKLDKVHFYSYCRNAFTKEECKKIIQIAKKKGLILSLQGFHLTTKDKSGLEESYQSKFSDGARKSKICWLYPSNDMEWVFRRVTDIVLDLNNRFFNFNIFGLNEGFQFTNYKAPSDKYEKHIDRSLDMIVRKLSISIQLTEPKEYEGGELYLYDDDKGTLLEKKQGTLIMFPSYILHEVKPVTKGERSSLVTWVTGDQFK